MTTSSTDNLRWARAVVGTRSEHSLNRLLGHLADGVVFKKLTKREFDELKDPLELDQGEFETRYKLLLLIREDVFCEPSTSRKRNHAKYYYLLRQISIFIRITVDPDAFVTKKYTFEPTLVELDDSNLINNIYSDHWPKLLNSYEQNKTTFMLFSAATVTDRMDNIFNLMNSVISLEAILLSGESSENSYKFRMRGAYLLSSSAKEREYVYRFLKYAYELRSAIVHSDDTQRRRIRKKMKEDFGFTIFEANSELIKMNRFILKLFLNRPDIFKDLDSVILQGGFKGEPYTNTHMQEKLKARAKTFRGLQRKAELKKKSKEPLKR